MKLYFSGLGGAQQFIIDHVKTFPVQRALASYAFPDQLPKLIKNGFTSLFLDCGAYSVYKSGVEIDIDSFIDFGKEHQSEVDAIASLDVIDDYEGSLRNYRYIVKRGLEVWPTYHFGEPQQLLQEYVAETDHICLGGVAGAGVSRGAIGRNLAQVYSQYPHLKVHVFGVNSFDVLMPLPVYSVDALTWRSGSRFGDVFVNGRRFKVGRTSRDSSFNVVADWLLENSGMDVRDPDFKWSKLDLWNIDYLFNMLEVEHAKQDITSITVPVVLF